jgi:hypothetical protein
VRYWESAAVDPSVIPMGSRLFVPAYCDAPTKGWMYAEDVGGAIIGRHIDVFRPPPRARFGLDPALRDQRVFVFPPGARLPKKFPSCADAGPVFVVESTGGR